MRDDEDYLPPLPGGRVPERSKSRSTARLVLILAALVGVVILLSKCGGGASEPAMAPAKQAPASSASPNSPSAPPSWNSAVETSAPPQSKAEILTGVIERALGESNRDVERVEQVDYDPKTRALVVKYALDDNLFGEDMIRIGGWKDNAAIIEALNSTTVPISDLVTIGTFEYLDDLGNSVGEKPAFIVGFKKRAIYNVNLENLPGEMLASAAYLINGPFAHPEERKGF